MGRSREGLGKVHRDDDDDEEEEEEEEEFKQAWVNVGSNYDSAGRHSQE